MRNGAADGVRRVEHPAVHVLRDVRDVQHVEHTVPKWPSREIGLSILQPKPRMPIGMYVVYVLKEACDLGAMFMTLAYKYIDCGMFEAV